MSISADVSDARLAFIRLSLQEQSQPRKLALPTSNLLCLHFNDILVFHVELLISVSEHKVFELWGLHRPVYSPA